MDDNPQFNMTNGAYPAEVQKFTSYLLSGDKRKASGLSNAFVREGHELVELYEGIIKPSLYTIGHLWETNVISVADEHLATAITESILNDLYGQIVPDQYSGKKAVLACAEEENHRVGLRMVADVLEMHRWETFFLGMGFPTNELIRFIDSKKPDLLALSLSVDSHFDRFENMVAKIRVHYPDLPIILGGQGLLHGKAEMFQNENKIHYLPSLKDIHTYLDRWSA